MEPEIAAAGDDVVLQTLQQHPPDFIIITSHDLTAHGFRVAQDEYGDKFLEWIRSNYQIVKTEPGALGITWYQRRTR